jgi:hypothetical protein
MSVRCQQGHHAAIKEFEELKETPEFDEQLKQAITDPNG